MKTSLHLRPMLTNKFDILFDILLYIDYSGSGKFVDHELSQ